MTDQQGGANEGQDRFAGDRDRSVRDLDSSGAVGEGLQGAASFVPGRAQVDPGIAAALDVVHRARLHDESEYERRKLSETHGAVLVETVLALFFLAAIFLGFYFLMGWAA